MKENGDVGKKRTFKEAELLINGHIADQDKLQNEFELVGTDSLPLKVPKLKADTE